MALRDNTIKLFFNVTKAKLKGDAPPVQKTLERTCARDLPREEKARDKREAVDANSSCPSAS
jgi:hypothetical protein